MASSAAPTGGATGTTSSTTSTTTTGSVVQQHVELDTRTVVRKIRQLYESWRSARAAHSASAAANEGGFGGVDAIAMVTGVGDDVSVSPGFVLQQWLLGWELTDTLLVMCESTFFVLTGPNKVNMFASLKDSNILQHAPKVSFEIVTKTKETLQVELEKIVTAIQGSYSGKVVGVLAQEHATQTGKFAKKCAATVFGQKGFTLVDVYSSMCGVMCLKDANEHRSIHAAATVAVSVLQGCVIPEVETIVDEGKKVSHKDLAATVKKAMENPRRFVKKNDMKNIEFDYVEASYMPMIQSGGVYNFTPGSTTSNFTDNLHFGTILFSIGIAYKYYNACLARTIFIEPTEDQKEVYHLVLECQETLLEHLKPGKTIGSAVSAVRALVERKRADLLPNLSPTLGSGIGIVICEPTLVMEAGNTTEIKTGMSFNVAIGFSNVKPKIESTDPKKSLYSILLADTFLVNDEVTCVTSGAPKDWASVSYSFQDEPEVPASTVSASSTKPTKPTAIKVPSDNSDDDSHMLSERRSRTRDAGSNAEAIRRKKHQEELARKKQEEARQMFGQGSVEPNKGKSTVVASCTYNDPSFYPREATPYKIYVDAMHDSVMLPMFGYMVPFHISTIKNVTSHEDSLRINFVTPATIFMGKQEEQRDTKSTFIRELSYRIPDSHTLSNTERSIKELRKKVAVRSSDKRNQEEIVQQEKLKLGRGRVPKLSFLYIQPPFAGRRATGTLEAHVNGFRFISGRGISIDIMYKNIKHAFFQPAEKDLIVLIHFHLHHPIMIGQKKTIDVQFYTEVMELSASLDHANRRLARDEDEIEEEQRDRKRIEKLNSDFHNFTKNVEDMVDGTGDNSHSLVEFDMPYRALAFSGVLLQPTSNCLVNLSEPPPFVLSLDEVEVVHLERVSKQGGYVLRNFDMVFVLKDYTKAVVQINSIPVSSLDTVRAWLDSCNIKYYEGPTNLNWKNVMNTIRGDLNQFFEDGGWNFLSISDDEDDNDEADGSQSDFTPPSSDASSSSGEESYSDGDASAEESAQSSGVDTDDEDEVIGSSDEEDAAAKGGPPSTSSAGKPAGREKSGAAHPTTAAAAATTASAKPPNTTQMRQTTLPLVNSSPSSSATTPSSSVDRKRPPPSSSTAAASGGAEAPTSKKPRNQH
ncbi:FACT complex subunit SPT16 [Pelomyxa schiedti]|nr:FACT complex subunit SPT16 [Pelomyxa schiedti]